jgi:hypothetical protein
MVVAENIIFIRYRHKTRIPNYDFFIVMYHVYMSPLYTYRTHELTKFIKKFKKTYMFFSFYFICV